MRTAVYCLKRGSALPKGPFFFCSHLVNQATQFVGRRFGEHWKQEDWPLMILLKPYHFWACHWSAWARVAKTCALPSLPHVAVELWASKCPRHHEGDEAQHTQVEVPQATSQFHVE